MLVTFVRSGFFEEKSELECKGASSLRCRILDVFWTMNRISAASLLLCLWFIPARDCFIARPLLSPSAPPTSKTATTPPSRYASSSSSSSSSFFEGWYYRLDIPPSSIVCDQVGGGNASLPPSSLIVVVVTCLELAEMSSTCSLQLLLATSTDAAEKVPLSFFYSKKDPVFSTSGGSNCRNANGGDYLQSDLGNCTSFTCDPQSLAISTADKMAISSNLTIEKSGWGGKGSERVLTESWISKFGLFDPHWQILISEAECSGTLTGLPKSLYPTSSIAFNGARLYAEKNWGSKFPCKWFWAQCNTWEMKGGSKASSLSVTAGGGTREVSMGPLLTFSQSLAMIGVHHDGIFYNFVPWGKDLEVSWDVRWGSWTFVAVKKKTKTEPELRCELRATCDGDGAWIRTPQPEGMVKNCRDAFGDGRLTIWSDGEVVVDATTEGSMALEIGGGWEPGEAWEGRSEMGLMGKAIRVGEKLPKVKLTRSYLFASFSSFYFALSPKKIGSRDPLSLVVSVSVTLLSLASATHWVTWEWRDDTEQKLALAAHVTDLSCMGLVPSVLALRSLAKAGFRLPVLALWLAFAVPSHAIAVAKRFDESTGGVWERDARFNRAFTRIVLLSVAIMGALEGPKKLLPNVCAAVLGSAVKLLSAYRLDGAARFPSKKNKRILDLGTAFFHLSFAWSIRDLIIKQRS